MVGAEQRHRSGQAGGRESVHPQPAARHPVLARLEGAVVAVEDDQLSNPVEFARDLTSLLQQPDAEQMTGLLIGRFQRASGFNRNLLEQIVARHDLLKTIPVVANMDFGHTSPLATLPIGGDVQLIATDNNPELRVLSH